MNKFWIKQLNVTTIALLTLLGMAACGDGEGNDSEPTTAVEPTTTPEPATITDANVGRCAMTYSSAPDAYVLLFDAEGLLVEIKDDGNLMRSPLAHTCFSEGEPIAVEIRPSSELALPTAAGDSTVSISSEEYFAMLGSADGFEIGAKVMIGAGTSEAESRTITELEPFTLDSPLDYPHEADDVVVVIEVVE